MLIKLVCGGPETDISALKAEVGARFLRYILDGAYDKGEVIEIRDDLIVVDFTDTVRSFPHYTVTLVHDAANGEHLMCYGEGELLKDFRGKKTNNPRVETVEDLLDFDNWMV